MIEGFDLDNTIGSLDEMMEYREKGALRGVYLGFPAMKDFYSMSLPGVTDWTGIPQSGKTQLLVECLLNTSEYYGWKHLVYFPDVGKPTEIKADLLHRITGRTFDKRYKNVITEDDIAKWLPWIDHHFKILCKKDLKSKITPIQFWDYAVEIKKSEGLQTAAIDSWKDMFHNIKEVGGNLSEYHNETLSYRNALCEQELMHFHQVVHPLKTDKDSNGKKRPPGAYDLKGGTAWNDNGKNIITVHREGNISQVYFNKIKPRSIGKVGMIEMKLDLARFRYFSEDQGERVYHAKEYRELKSTEISGIEDDNDDLPF